jgi:hypothetical protein
MQYDQSQPQLPKRDEAYLKIWEIAQQHAQMRWAVMTFFMSVSFAIFGFSFQDNLPPSESLVLRIAGLLIYWFAVLLLLHFYRFTKFLRRYLIQMEETKQTNLDVQGKAAEARMAQMPFSTIGLVLYFGVIYTAGVLLLVWLHL